METNTKHQTFQVKKILNQVKIPNGILYLHFPSKIFKEYFPGMQGLHAKKLVTEHLFPSNLSFGRKTQGKFSQPTSLDAYSFINDVMSFHCPDGYGFQLTRSAE